MKKQSLAVAVFSAAACAASGALNPPVRTDADRNATLLKVDMERIGTLRQKDVREVGDSNWTIDGAPVDRDFVQFDKYCDYLPALGVKKIRIMTGWAYAVPSDRQIVHATGTTFVRIPAYDSPCVLTERAAVDLMK